MNIGEEIKKRLMAELKYYEGSNFANPSISSSLNSTIAMTMVDIHDEQGGFDVEFSVEHEPETIIELTWWPVGAPTNTHNLVFRFGPLRVEDGSNDLISAYERAMKVI